MCYESDTLQPSARIRKQELKRERVKKADVRPRISSSII